MGIIPENLLHGPTGGLVIAWEYMSDKITQICSQLDARCLEDPGMQSCLIIREQFDPVGPEEMDGVLGTA